MAQVLTNENMVEFIQTRQAPEFKAPEPPKDESAKPNSAEVKPNSVTDTAEPAKGDAIGRERGPDGKFVKTEEKTEEAVKTADDDDTSSLSKPIKDKIDRLIAKKHRAMKEAEEFGRDEARRAMAAEARAAALQREIEALKGTKSGEGPAPDDSEDEPKPENFKTVGEYTRALTKYEVAKAKREALANAEKAKEQDKAEKTQAQANERAQTFAKRQAEFMKATPDYEEIVEGADFDVPNVAMQYMVESEYGPQLAYHLAKNPDVADRLRNLSPGRVLAELGKLESKFEKQPEAQAAPTTRTVSKAPPPITPLEGKTTPVTKDPSQMSFAELRALREQQKREGKWRV